MTNLLYKQVADHLRTEITNGSFGAGILPTEAQLCERFGASRSTIRKALQSLRSDRLVVSRQGSGWSVTPTVPRMRLGVQGTNDGGNELKPVDCRQTTPPEQVATVLLVEADIELLLVERAATTNGTIVHRSETWFAPHIGGELDIDRARIEPPALLLSRVGYPIAEFDQFVEAVLSNTRDEELIGVPPRSPILQVTRVAIDTDRVPLFLSLHRHPGDSTRIDVDLPTTDNPNGPTVSLTPDC